MAWDAIAGVVVDTGQGRGFPYETLEGRRFLLDAPASGIPPSHRPPLLSTVPVRPNLLILIDPPAVLPWCHPEPAALSFAGFRTPGASARPWGSPKETPAVWCRVEDVESIADVAEARGRLRALTKQDVHRLRYELGDLPRPPAR